MLIRKLLYAGGDELIYTNFVTAMGAETTDKVPWPLPNAVETTQEEYWRLMTLWGPKAMAHAGQVSIDGWASVTVWYLDVNEMANGGFAVAYFHVQNRVEYWRWGACDHRWTSRTISRCLHRYSCEKCGADFTVDSGD